MVESDRSPANATPVDDAVEQVAADAEAAADALTCVEDARAVYGLETERITAYATVLAELIKVCGRVELDESFRTLANSQLVEACDATFLGILEDIDSMVVRDRSALRWGEEL